jgi:hypothetical protein
LLLLLLLLQLLLLQLLLCWLRTVAFGSELIWLVIPVGAWSFIPV